MCTSGMKKTNPYIFFNISCGNDPRSPSFSRCRLANTQPTVWSDTRNPVDWCTVGLVVSRDESEILRNRFARFRTGCGPTRNSTACAAPCNVTDPQRPLLFVLFFVICVVRLLFVLFSVLFVCKCVLYYCHRVATQLQLTNISYIKFVNV